MFNTWFELKKHFLTLCIISEELAFFYSLCYGEYRYCAGLTYRSYVKQWYASGDNSIVVIAWKGGYTEDAFSTNLVPFVSVDWIAFPRSVAKSLFPSRIGPLRPVYLFGTWNVSRDSRKFNIIFKWCVLCQALSHGSGYPPRRRNR